MTNEMNEKIDEKSSKAVLDRLTIICTVLTILISAIILTGWLLNLFDMSRSNPIYKPMSPGSSLSFIVLGCALLVYFFLPFDHTARKLAKFAVALIFLFDLIILADFIIGYGFEIERFILPYPLIVNNVIIGRMSTIGTASFLISSFALLLLLFSPERKHRTKIIAAYLASVSLYIGIIILIGYLYGTPLFYGGTMIPTSLFTGITFIIFSIGLMSAAGMEYLPLRLFIGNSVRARLMRSFVPVIITYILLEGILEIIFFPYPEENVLESSVIMIFFFIFGIIITSRIAQTVGDDVDRKNLIQRELAACALRESESKFRMIFETVPDGLGLTRIKDGILIETNNVFSQMFGYTKDELIGKTTRELDFWVDPDDRNKMLEQLRSRGVAYGMEVKYRKKSGEISIGTYSAAKLMINSEPHLIISSTDISERKRSEEMLSQSEEKYRGLIENIQDGIFIIQDAKLKFVNEAFARIAGYSAQEIIGMDFRDLLAPEDKELVIDRYTRRLKGEKVPSEYEFRLRRKDGTIITVDMNVGAFTYFSRKASIGILKDITQRKLMEKEREDSIILAQNEKNKSEAIIAALGDGIIIQDTDYIITYQNKLQTLIYGEHAGEHCYKVYEHRDTICEDCPVEKTFLDGKVHRTERSVLAGNKMSYYELTSSPLRDSSGKIIAGVKMVRDITDRKLAEEMLKLHDNRLKDMLELHRLGDATEKEIFDFALSASLRTVQSDFAFIGLMTADEAVMTNHVWSKKVMSDCQISEKPVEFSIAQAGLWGEVVRQRRPIIVNDYTTSKEFKKGYPHGHVPIERFLGIPIISGTRIVAVACVANKACDYTESDVSAFTSLIHEMWDILEHRQKEEEVSKNRAMLLKAQEIGHVGSWEWDIATNDLVWTKEIYSIYGLDPDTVQPKYELVLNTMSPESKTEFIKAIDDALRFRKPFEMEYGLIRPDGSNSFVHTKGEVLFDSEGQPVTMFGMVQDITQRRIAEAERVQFIEKENKASSEVEAARKLDRMKSMFLASTSHELRTPLNSVIGFSSLLLEGYSGQLNPDQKEQLEIVHSSGKHLLTLINDILDISKIEAGSINVEICEFKLRSIVDDAVSMLRVSLLEKKLDLRVNVQDIVMRSDRKRLFQCIVNLLGNAIKYTEKGSVEIIVKAINNNVIITVADTGIGMKTEDIPKLFGPFVRLQTPLTYKTSGTGLGLYLVKKLASDFLGGDVEVESEVGKGSTFTMRIPVELDGKK